MSILLLPSWLRLDLLCFTVFQKMKIVEKFVASSASLHIYNVQTKGAQHKSMVKSMNRRRWLHLLVNS